MKGLRAQTLSKEENGLVTVIRSAPGSTSVQSCCAASERAGDLPFCIPCEDDVGSSYIRSVFARGTYSSQALPVPTHRRYSLEDR